MGGSSLFCDLRQFSIGLIIFPNNSCHILYQYPKRTLRCFIVLIISKNSIR